MISLRVSWYVTAPMICDCSHDMWLLPLSFSIQHIWTCNHWWSGYHSTWEMISHGPNFREPQHINWTFKMIIDAVEDYARRWIKREVDQDPELESLSDWVRTIRSLVQGRIRKLKNCVNSRPKSVFKDQEVVKCLSSLHDKYVIVPDKASNNIVFVCKSYYYEYLIKEIHTYKHLW